MLISKRIKFESGGHGRGQLLGVVLCTFAHKDSDLSRLPLAPKSGRSKRRTNLKLLFRSWEWGMLIINLLRSVGSRFNPLKSVWKALLLYIPKHIWASPVVWNRYGRSRQSISCWPAQNVLAWWSRISKETMIPASIIKKMMDRATTIPGQRILHLSEFVLILQPLPLRQEMRHWISIPTPLTCVT